MRIVVLASDAQRNTLAPVTDDSIFWIREEDSFLDYTSADAFVDLLYVNTAKRNSLLKSLSGKCVLINDVPGNLQETDPSFVRFNGWNTFLSSAVIEAACINESVKAGTEAVFSSLGKKVEWLPDTPGFVTARVVSMIINEAYLALAENVSTKEEIDTAMKMGTAYPYGPFEWAAEIGVQNIVTLLKKLSAAERRYQPAALLLEEANAAT